MRSKVSSVRALTASVTPAASTTRWPRLRKSSASVERADTSSSTMRMSAMPSGRLDGQGDHEPRALPGFRLDVDVAAVGGHDPPHDGQSQAGASRLLGEERLEDAPPLLGRNA